MLINNNIIIFLVFLSLISSLSKATELLPDVGVLEKGKHVVINIPQLRLFLYEDGNISKVYQIAVGKNRTQTPIGEFLIGETRYKPHWYVPLSIQKERQRQGRPIQTVVPPGPGNPLGPVFIRFGNPGSGYGIHGTNVPSSVPGVRSHGCVRMKSPHALELAATIKKDTKLSVVYQLYSLNKDELGQVWLRAYDNPYKFGYAKIDELQRVISTVIGQNGVMLDLQDIDNMVKNARKRLVCINCTTENPQISGMLASIAWTDGLVDVRNLIEYQEIFEDIIFDNILGQVRFKKYPSLTSPLWQKSATEDIDLDFNLLMEILE